VNVRLNLATNALQTHRKFLAASGLIGAVAGIVFLALGWHVYSVRKAEENIRAQQDQIRQEMLGLQHQRRELEEFFARPENAKLHDRSSFLNTLIDQQSMNWTQMFMDLERIVPAGVRMLDVEPKHEKGRVLVRFHIGAVSDEAKVRFVRALEDSHVFANVKEVSDRYVDAGTPGPDRLLVELLVEYVKT
jgi:Tfp pilus assembly protein PilN